MGEKDERYKKLRPVPIPNFYSWLFTHFMGIWQDCEYDLSGTKVFRCRNILDYEQVFGVHFSFYERKLLVKMKNWAMETIAELNKKED